MALTQPIEIDDFSGGWRPDVPAESLAKNEASKLENADVRNRSLKTLAGTSETLTGLPTGFVKISAGQFKFTQPSEKNVDIIYGTLSGVDKLYAKPYPNSVGSWVDSWLDLTENEGNYTASNIAGGAAGDTDTTNVYDLSSLLSTTDDYYNDWIFYNVTRKASAIVTDYIGADRHLILSWAIASQTVGDTYFLLRNPVHAIFQGDYQTKLNLFAPENEVRFTERENGIAVITGSDIKYPDKSDLILFSYNGQKKFGDSDLDFTGFYLTRKHLDPIFVGGGDLLTLTATAVGAGEVALPTVTTGYLVMLIPIYDGFQEAPLETGVAPFLGESFFDGNFVSFQSPAADNSKIKIDFDLYYGRTDTRPVELLTRDASTGVPEREYIIFDRRISGFKIYMAEARQVASATDAYEPTTEWRFVKSVDIDGETWTGITGPNYTKTENITGADWEANAGIDITDYQGHESVIVNGNSDFVAGVRGRTYYASVHTDKRRVDFVYGSPIKGGDVDPGLNQYDIIPQADSVVDVSTYGMPRILGIEESLGFLVVLGDNKIIRLDVDNFQAGRNYQNRGISSKNGIRNVNNLLYLTSPEDIYEYNPTIGRAGIVRSIAKGRLRETWEALSDSDKQNAAIGYDARHEMLIVAAGSTIYLFNLPQVPAADVTADIEAIGAWSVYNVSLTFNRFYTQLDGSCVGIASDGKAYLLFASGQTNTMVWESPVIQHEANIQAVKMTYNATANVTLKLYDLELSATSPLRTYIFPPRATHQSVEFYEGDYVERLKIGVEAGINTEISKIIFNHHLLEN